MVVRLPNKKLFNKENKDSKGVINKRANKQKEGEHTDNLTTVSNIVNFTLKRPNYIYKCIKIGFERKKERKKLIPTKWLGWFSSREKEREREIIIIKQTMFKDGSRTANKIIIYKKKKKK